MKIKQAFSFDDISLVPKFSKILPNEISVKTQLTSEISLNIPIMSAAMDMVTEAPMAIALAYAGGVGVIHRNLSPEDQSKEVEKVKRVEGKIVQDPITLDSATPIKQALAIAEEVGFMSFPIVDEGSFIGMVTSRDFRFASATDYNVGDIMTLVKDLYVSQGGEDVNYLEEMRLNRVERIPIVENQNGKLILKGLVNMKDVLMDEKTPNAARASDGSLLVGAAIGCGDVEIARAEMLKIAGVDVLVIDTAHGDSKGVIDTLKEIKRLFPEIQVIAGNVCTADGAIRLENAGADAIKVGMGCGSICTTRIIAGVGVPQFSAVYNVAEVASVPVICDGGIRYSGDIVKALFAGANVVMLGNLFAGTTETPGELELYQGRSYKSYRGMGSIGAMSEREQTKDRYKQTGVANDKLVPEGVEGRVPYRGDVTSVIHQLVGGIKSGLGYCGAATISELQMGDNAIRVTHTGLMESHVHDVDITRQSPNYNF